MQCEANAGVVTKRKQLLIQYKHSERNNLPRVPCCSQLFHTKKSQNVDLPYVVNMQMLVEALQNCQHCRKGPRNLSNITEDIRSEGVCPILKIKCNHCNLTNTVRPVDSHRSGKRGPPALDINSRAGLGALHSGLGHTHCCAFLSLLGLPSLASRNVKIRERESGRVIEQIAKRTCDLHTEKEKGLSQLTRADEEDVVKIGISYDMGWRKRGHSHDSSYILVMMIVRQKAV